MAYLGKFILKPDIDIGRKPGSWTVKFPSSQRQNFWKIRVFFIKPAILRSREYKKKKVSSAK